MPVFYSYEAQADCASHVSHLTLEADGRLLDSFFYRWNFRPSNWLGVPTQSSWAVQAKGNASWGVAEFTPDDDGDNLLFWKVEAGKVLLRVQNRVIVLDVSHINQPSAPSNLEIGGEG